MEKEKEKVCEELSMQSEVQQYQQLLCAIVILCRSHLQLKQIRQQLAPRQ